MGEPGAVGAEGDGAEGATGVGLMDGVTAGDVVEGAGAGAGSLGTGVASGG